MKRTLTCESCNSRLTLVIIKKDGDNLVLPIGNGDSYDYFIVGGGDDDISWFGYIDKHPEYKNYVDLKKKYIDEGLKELDNEYLKGRSEEYFNSTSALAEEYEKLNEEFHKLLYDKTIPDKKKYKNPIFKKRQGFEYDHSEISKLDIRICNLSYTDLEFDKNGKLTNMHSHFFEPSPRIDYKSYKEFIDEFVANKKKEYAYYCKEELDELDEEFNLAKAKIIDLLDANDKVGIVSLKVAMPKRMKEIEMKIDSFDVDAFLSFSINTIYWISK